MLSLLKNPVYNALVSNDRVLGRSYRTVAWFDEDVSPFAGFDENEKDGFQQLFDELPKRRKILFASPFDIVVPPQWKLLAHVPGLQFLWLGKTPFGIDEEPVVPLTTNHVPEMIELTALTKPGPFAARTIEFGHYHGIFENGRLAAMTGQRLHIDHYSEISAVCTHPDFLGRGYATLLLKHQINLILSQNAIPFLHVRDDNRRAIDLYERLGFINQGKMNFYFMMKRDEN